jgi:hypothetical protein
MQFLDPFRIVSLPALHQQFEALFELLADIVRISDTFPGKKGIKSPLYGSS